MVAEVKTVTSGRGVDVVFDPVGGDIFDASRRVIAFEGRILIVGFAGGRIADAPTNHVLVKNYDVRGALGPLSEIRSGEDRGLACRYRPIVASGPDRPACKCGAAIDPSGGGPSPHRFQRLRWKVILVP